jgi:hypothetical protein
LSKRRKAHDFLQGITFESASFQIGSEEREVFRRMMRFERAIGSPYPMHFDAVAIFRSIPDLKVLAEVRTQAISRSLA